VTGSIDMALKQALGKPGDAPAIPAAKDEQLAQLRAAFIPLARAYRSPTPICRGGVWRRLDEFPATHARHGGAAWSRRGCSSPTGAPARDVVEVRMRAFANGRRGGVAASRWRRPQS